MIAKSKPLIHFANLNVWIWRVHVFKLFFFHQEDMRQTH